MNDLIRLACERAVDYFGGSDGTFNAACFSGALTKLAGVNGAIDGNVVRVILAGRPDVEPLKGGEYYRLVTHIAHG